MKKAISCILAAALSVSMLVGCGSDKGSSSSTSTSTDTTAQSSSASAGTEDTGNAITASGGDVTYAIDTSNVSPASAVDMKGLLVTDSMVSQGILRAGNVQRIADALYRASKGESITIAFIGSNATSGNGASSEENSYVSLVTKWFDECFVKTDIKVVNVSFSGQDSYIAAHRVTDEVLPSSPDIVFIETALADGQSAQGEEAFEGIARQLLEGEAAVIPVTLTNNSLTNYGKDQSALAMQMDLPVISPGTVIKNNVDNGTWKWTDVAESDTSSNPNDAGHALIAYLIDGFMQRVLDGIGSSAYTRYTLPSTKKTSCRYMNGKFLTSKDITGTGFTIESLPGCTLDGFTVGWATHDGSTGEFKLTGNNIGLVWFTTIDGKGGDFDFYVDGEKVRDKQPGSSLNEDSSVESFTGIMRAELGRYDSTSHTVSISKNEASEGNEFYTLAFLVS